MFEESVSFGVFRMFFIVTVSILSVELKIATQLPIAIAIRNLYFHPLSRYPGPSTWCAFRFRYCYTLWKGDLVQDLHRIHLQYGPFVRVAPNEISVAHPDGWDDIHRRRPGHLSFPKNPIWWGELPDRTPSIVSAATPEDHKRMRDLLSHCFTPKALKAQESTINLHINKMIEELRKRCLQGQNSKSAVVNIVEWFCFVTFDITGDLGFAESFHCLESNSMHPWVEELFSYGRVGALVAAMRHYAVLFKIFMQCIPKSVLDASLANFNWGVQKTHQRLNLEVQREDWIKYILHNSNEETGDSLSIGELENNMNVLIFAGSDTCSTVLSGTTNHLIKSPHALLKLTNEIRTTYSSMAEMTFESLQRLSYLNAVIEEGLRMCPPNPSGLQHIVPVGGDTVLGHWLPAGTHVGVHQQSLYRSPHYFHEANTFHPERWLSSAKSLPGSPFRDDKLEAVQSFSTGTWGCIGKGLALAELRSVMARLVWNFDMSVAPGGRDVDWLSQKSYAMLERQPLDVQLVLERSETL
ncbi:cytochrome P450 [Massariosphaeria phaeospora]|uniref:Cytochrome P450 n=1 Tax=Massariosphaeria phaeospora TaxID=100035 RepID=A0A7C8ME08_9PLEO|nr:cytochrome P450 [Massariosphaeria phaeospora]